MQRCITAVCALLLMGLLAACGGDGSTAANTAIYTTGVAFTLPAPPASFQLGGSIQGTALTLTPTVSLLVGSTGTTGFADGTGGIGLASTATFNHPVGITTDGTYLYVADYLNHCIRRVNPATGETKTIAGTSGVPGLLDANGINALFNRPSDITTDGTNLYVTDSLNNAIRRITLDQDQLHTVTTIAGSALAGNLDSTVKGTEARFNQPNGITIVNGASLYVADSFNHTIRMISLTAPNAVTTLAGTPGSAGWADGIKAAAHFNLPTRLTTDGTDLFVADY